MGGSEVEIRRKGELEGITSLLEHPHRETSPQRNTPSPDLLNCSSPAAEAQCVLGHVGECMPGSTQHNGIIQPLLKREQLVGSHSRATRPTACANKTSLNAFNRTNGWVPSVAWNIKTIPSYWHFNSPCLLNIMSGGAPWQKIAYEKKQELGLL